MKKRIGMFLAVAMAAVCAWADTWTDPDTGYTWTYRVNGDEAEIYNGSSSPAISPSPTGAVTIPSTLGGTPVTSIGASAFYGCRGLTSVTIPDNVASIGDGAFSGCSGLEEITLPFVGARQGDPLWRISDGHRPEPVRRLQAVRSDVQVRSNQTRECRCCLRQRSIYSVAYTAPHILN